MKPAIQFGTDGWRALIGDGFTTANLRVVAQAFADWIMRARGRRARVLIGYDGRFGGERFALAAARVLAGNGLRTDVTAEPVPTPALSWWILRRRYDGGLMITASHNPPAYSGVKVKPHFGGSPDETVIGALVAALGRRPPRDGGAVRRVTFTPAYDAMIRSLVDLRALRRLRGTVVHDPMGGVQLGRLDAVLRGLPLRIVRIHDRLDPMFCGLDAPEPVEKNLRELMEAVPRHRALLGIATDGDGDRVGIVSNDGTTLSPHLIYALLLLFMIRERKLTGGVVKTVSGSFLLDRIARAHGLELHETPVGFKHICRLMREDDILMG
ncbi:MAG: phosphoglucomutase/phosphomannomutase family protein, partial [bacterium]